MNSIGNLLLHIRGNLRQLIVSGVGGLPDDRDRQSEFDARGPMPADDLLRSLFAAVKDAQETVGSVGAESLCAAITVKRFDWTGIQAVVRSIAHFRGHTQEIIHMTRMLLGDRYEFAGQR
jgi:hypothetical protein